MSRFLKQSTAFTFRAGPFVDSTDGVTAETALTIAQADIQISKAGGAFAQTSSSPTTTHDADGWYQCPLTSTDTGTVGALTVQITMAGALPVWHDFMVLPANVYDSLVGGTDLLDVNTAQWLGTACATPTVAGVPEVDATHWNGTAVATPATAGHPVVTLKVGTGTGEVNLSSGSAPIRTNLKKNQALAAYSFLMTDSTNHNPATGLTVTATRSVDGGAFGAGTLGAVTEIGVGMYKLDLAAGDMNGNVVTLRFTATGADDLFVTLITEP